MILVSGKLQLSAARLTFCGVQQRHHEAVDSQVQQQVWDHLQEIVWDLQGRKCFMTAPSHNKKKHDDPHICYVPWLLEHRWENSGVTT